jgi:P-type Cu+ transporter
MTRSSRTAASLAWDAGATAGVDTSPPGRRIGYHGGNKGNAMSTDVSDRTMGSGAAATATACEQAECCSTCAPPATGGEDGYAVKAAAAAGLIFGGVLLLVVAGEWLGLIDAVTDLVPLPVGALLVLLVGLPAFRGVVRATAARRVTSHTLMTVGVLAALAVGQWATAAVVAFFMRVGDRVEGMTVRRSRRALRELAALAPAVARVERDGVQQEVPVATLRPGDIVVVRPGERVPADGVVVSGRAAVEQAAITGESMPVDVAPGTFVHAATLPRGGALRVRVERTGDDATFGRILQLVGEAETNRAEVQRFADRFTAWYLPVVATIALLTFVIRRDPLATAAVLVVACSCAFAIATPVAMLASIGAAARRGLLIRGGAYIEALARADVLLLDKTGTCTVGRPVAADIVALDGTSADEVLRLAACAEHDSEHPIAAAIRAAAGRRGIAITAPHSFAALEGMGVRARVGAADVVVGNVRAGSGAAAGAGARTAAGAAPRPHGGAADGLAAVVAGMESGGATVACVWRDGSALGAIAIRDEIRPDVAAAIAALRDLGITRIELLTGDNAGAAAPVAAALGIEARAGLLPDDKLRIVREHQAAGRTVVMVGDGVNDAPALAAADVGIAMGATGSDLALEVAHVALLRDDWGLVPDAFRTARRTMRVVRGNFGFTGAYNVVGLTLAALGFLPPVLAAAAQSIPDLGILGNSARLFRRT